MFNSKDTFRALFAIAAVAGTCALTNACGPARAEPVRAVEGGRAERGPDAIAKYGCGACHTIPGVDGATSLVAPPLTGFAHRIYIAGEVSNTAEHLITWITVPQVIEPGTDMPNLGVTDQEARDIAAYLYTLR
jgi:cytochrome c